MYLVTSKDLVTGGDLVFESEFCNFVKCFLEIIISNVLSELNKN